MGFLLNEFYPDSHNRHNPVSVDPGIWSNLLRDWTSKYYGESLDALKWRLRDYESIVQKSDTHYYPKYTELECWEISFDV